MPLGGRRGFADKKPSKPKEPKTLVGLTPKKGDRYRGTGDTLVAYDQAPMVKGNIVPVPDVSAAGRSANISPGLGSGGGTNPGSTVPGQTVYGQGYQTYDQLNPGASSTGGFADRYTVPGMAEMFYHPDVLGADYLGSLGITNPELIDQYANLTRNAYALQLVMQGAPGGADATQFVADLLQQYSTPNGDIPDFDTLINMLLNPGSNEMSAAYAAQAPATGSGSVNDLIMSLLQATGANPYYQKAMQGQLDQNQRGYYSDQFQGAQGPAAGTYADMLRKQGIFG